MKVQKIILIIVILLSYNNISSQNSTFEYLSSSHLDEYFSDIVETTDGSIYFSSRLSTIEKPYKKSVLVTKLDAYGSLIDSVTITFPNKSMYIYHMFATNNEIFTIVAGIFDTLIERTKSGIVFYNMDEELNFTNQTVYLIDSTYTLDAIFANIKADGDIMASIAVRVLPTQVSRSFIYQFSSDFDSINAKFYPDEARVISNFKDLLNGNYWLLNMSLSRYELLDSLLNFVSTQKIPNVISPNYGVVWDTDTSFYLLGDGILPSSSPHNLGFIRQFHPMDTTGHIYNHWNVSDTVDFPALWGGIDFKNKDSIFIGGTRDIWVGFYNRWPSWFIILQTDSLLNIRWERFYGGDAYYMMGKLIATNDGGCIVAGTRYDYMNTTELETDIIVLKLNGDGLITSNQGKPSIEMHEAIVYPNPGNAEIVVRIAVQYKQSVFELFDINGRHILKQDFTGTQGKVNTTFLENGTYIYRITSNDGLFETGKWIKQ
jgi:hypothetical protein